MKRSLTILALAAAATAACAPAQAQSQAQTIIKATASGPAESPPNGSPGSSVASFEIDGTILRAEVPFRDLLGDTTMAHIHCCTTESFTGVAPVALPFVDFPLGVRAACTRTPST
ncbi:CHRD domain-containing protein [Massilia sp.]|uniref:CHRD domain-containing protein n=1 Tax=Massilia sp. TaxID=1882437 RepID=UPI00289BF497|nr:CHRD domain-containing protein [Massilia sp.]